MTWPVSISATPSGTGNLGGTTPKHTELHTEIKNAIDDIVDKVGTKADSSEVTSLSGVVNFGDPATNGSWRIGISGENLLVQKKVSGNWVTKQTVEA